MLLLRNLLTNRLLAQTKRNVFDGNFVYYAGSGTIGARTGGAERKCEEVAGAEAKARKSAGQT